jgi:hypothetical protein
VTGAFARSGVPQVTVKGMAMHHAQSQLHRFLNCLGGYVRHVNSYSLGTSAVLLP